MTPSSLCSCRGFCAVALCGFLVSCGSKTETAAPPPAPQTNAVARGRGRSPELAKLVGKWERPDGGYIIEIKGVDPSGKLDVAYYNPDPINVSRAAAWRDKGATKVVIELRDVNYPGCTYNAGTQPADRPVVRAIFPGRHAETFEVVFARVK